MFCCESAEGKTALPPAMPSVMAAGPRRVSRMVPLPHTAGAGAPVLLTQLLLHSVLSTAELGGKVLSVSLHPHLEDGGI